MACYYYIKLPGGGEARIPANLVTITEQDGEVYKKLVSEVKLYYEGDQNLNKDSSLVALIKEITSLNTGTIKSIINNSNEDTLIENLNKHLVDNSGTLDLITSLRRNILFKEDKVDYKGARSTKFGHIGLGEFLERLNAPIGKKYLKGINTKGLIGTHSLVTITDKLKTNIDDNVELDLNYEASSLLLGLLNKVYYKSKRSAEVFFEMNFDSDISDAVVIKDSDTDNDIIFYNGLNDLSLFMGVFKSLARNLNKEDILPILEEYNNSFTKEDSRNKLNLENFDVVTFFTGKFEEDSKGNITFIEPDFNKLFRFKSNSNKTVTKLIDLVVPLVTDNPKSQKDLKANINTLFTFLSPNKFAKGINGIDAEAINNYNQLQKQERELTNQIRVEQILPLLSDDKYYYSYSKTSKDLGNIENAYNYILNNVTLGKDQLLVNIRDYSTYIVPTEIRLTTKGILVRGFYSDNGEYKHVYNSYAAFDEVIINKKKIKPENTIRFKTLEGTTAIIHQTNADLMAKNEQIIVVSDKSISESLLKDVLVRGSQVEYKTDKGKDQWTTIKGVYPGIIEGNSYLFNGKKVDPIINNNKIFKVITHRSLFEDEFTDADGQKKVEILSNLKKVIPTATFKPITKGDYIMYTDEKSNKYNKVISVTDDLVYILIKARENYVIKSIPKSSIKTIYKSPEVLGIEEVKNIAEFHNQTINDWSIKDYSYSLFDNYELAANGDFVIVPKDEGYNIYKITDKEKKEGIIFSLTNKLIKSYEYVELPVNVDNYQLVTSRNIYSNAALSTAELNNIFLLTEEKTITDNEHLQEVWYAIPQDLNIDQLLLLDSGNLVRGIMYENKDSVPKGYKDVTKQLINKINKMRDLSGTKLYMKKKGNYNVRYNARLYQTDFTIDTNSKEHLLKEHSFVVLKNESDFSKSANKTYAIIGRSENNLILEYSAFNRSGKLVSITKTLSLEDAKQRIKWLYVMKGSNAHKELETLKRESELKTVTKEKQDRKELLFSIANKFQTIFQIPVEIEERLEREFKSKKAWIKTETDSKPKIILNAHNDRMGEADVIHEYLHLFLMALKYNTINTSALSEYENLLRSYQQTISEKSSDIESEQDRYNTIASTDDLSTLEEYFVEDITNIFMQENYPDLDEFNYDNFLSAFNKSLEVLNVDTSLLDDATIFNILSSKMSAIFPRANTELAKSNLILFESNFRKWMTDQINKGKIIVECQ